MAFDLDEEELKATRKINKADRNEIEVNEYVRTKDGIIDKVIIGYKGKCNNSNCDRKHVSCKSNYYNEEDIVNHSNQLIDLIEDADILKIKISEEWVEKQDTIKFVVVGQTYTITEIKECLEDGLFEIMQILTHEQFDADCYEVEEEE